MAAIQNSTILDTATRLYPKGELATQAATPAGLGAVVGRVAADLKATSPADLAAIRDAIVAAWGTTNATRGAEGQKALGQVVSNQIQAPTTTGTRALDVRMPAVPSAVLNAVTPLLQKGALSEAQLTSGLARIHNAWFAQAKGDGYRLGERDKQDPVMKMARSFFVGVEAKGGQLSLKLGDDDKTFVRAYGRKQTPDRTLTDDEALAAGSHKIIGEIRANNQGALDESLRLVTAHLAGDVARLGTGDYLERVKAMGDIKTPGLKPSLSPPSKEKALELVQQRLKALDDVVVVLNTAGDASVARKDLPSSLHQAYDLLDEEHHRWVKTQVGYGVSANTDFVRSDELPGKRLALDAAPLRGAYETLAAGLSSGTLTPAALNAILPLLESGRLTPEKLTQGLALIHNDWFQKAKADGYVLGERNKADPVMKNARTFFVPVEARGGALHLTLDDKDAAFVRTWGRKQLPDQKLTDAAALATGSAQIIADINKNNRGALEETMKLVTGHLAGEVIRTGKDTYLDDVKTMGPVNLPAAAGTSLSPAEARTAVSGLLQDVDTFIAFLGNRATGGHGDQTLSREQTPPELRGAYDLFAEEHDRWLAQQIGWGSAPNADWVHTSALPTNRIVLDAAPIRGALLTLQSALEEG
jgi:hypothetical protein